MINSKLVCPNCGGINIKPIGIYYQCKALKYPNPFQRNHVSCGYIGSIDEFGGKKQAVL